MLCRNCKDVELTKEELSTKQQMCYWCFRSFHDLSKNMGSPVAEFPPPEDFGRTKEEVERRDRLMAGDPSGLRKENIFKEHFTQEPEEEEVSKEPNLFEQKSKRKIDSKEVSNMLRIMDSADQPPIEIDLALTDDFYIKASIPPPISPKIIGHLEEHLRKILRDLVFAKFQGTFVEPFLQDPDAPKQPQGPMGF